MTRGAGGDTMSEPGQRTYPENFIDKILCGDALDVMRQMPDECVDLIFADPPFNVGKAYLDQRDDYRAWVATWVSECFRLLKSHGSFYLMTLAQYLEWKMPLMAELGVFLDLIIWKNTSLQSAKERYSRSYQAIMLYSKGDEYTFHPKAEIVKRDLVVRASALKKKPELAYGYPGRVGNLWDDIKFISGGCMAPKEAILCEDSKKKAHPCQMPVKLAYRAIVFSTDPDAIVFDPFVGSGSTAVASIQAGRHYIGVDISPEYCKIARERIVIENSQLKLDLTRSGGTT